MAATAQRAAQDRGTLTTLAGPTFCEGRAVSDPASATVRGLAIGGDSSYFLTGPSGEASIAWAYTNTYTF
ncbi:MAG: hypothetical protein ABR532_09705, partial [Candidatus Dormibacteria bacterium]